MAVYGIQATNYARGIDPSSANLLDPGVFGGKVRTMYDTISTGTTALVSSDYIIVGTKLPAGAQVVNIKVFGTAASLTGSPIDIGDEGDPNRYMDGVMATSSGTVVGPTATTGIGYQVTGTTDNYIRITASGDDTQITAAIYKITVFYTVE